MNDTINERGLVPSRFNFGILPRFPTLNTDIRNQKDRMNAISTSQAKMNLIVAGSRVLTALIRDRRPAADRTCQMGEEVLVYN